MADVGSGGAQRDPAENVQGKHAPYIRKSEDQQRNTRPESAVNKQGTLGIAVTLTTNHVQVYGNELISVEGRQLGQPVLWAGEKELKYTVEQPEWMKPLRENPLEEPKKISAWLVLYPKEDEDAVRQFCAEIKRIGEPMGIVSPPKLVVVPNVTGQGNFIKCIKNQVDKGCELVLAVFPRRNKEMYDGLKTYLNSDLPCVSQVVLRRTVQHRRSPSVITRLVLQINAKRSGQLWRCIVPFEVPTVIVGVDVQLDRKVCRPVVNACGTSNQIYGHYVSVSTECQSNEDVVWGGVPRAIVGCAEAFEKKCGMWPQQVIVYRGGVSDGQLGNVVNVELREVLDALRSVATQNPITTTYVLVNQHESTKLFLEKSGATVNPRSETVVDHTITRSNGYDFYLVSHEAKNGTVTPTYYNCIHDMNQMTPDKLQNLTDTLTHMYFNWTGPICVPAPLQMARELSLQRSHHVHQDHHENMKNFQFYL